jgi:hypothetical protein
MTGKEAFGVVLFERADRMRMITFAIRWVPGTTTNITLERTRSHAKRKHRQPRTPKHKHIRVRRDDKRTSLVAEIYSDQSRKKTGQRLFLSFTTTRVQTVKYRTVASFSKSRKRKGNMAGECQTKNRNDDKEDDEKPIIALDEGKNVLL